MASDNQKVMIIDDILSIPYYALFSFATSSVRSYYKIFPFYFFSFSRWPIHFTISSFCLTSQIPSQPMMIKSIFSFLTFKMSGSAVIICSSGANLAFFLYSKSPIALERFKFPYTLPCTTSPPAF